MVEYSSEKKKKLSDFELLSSEYYKSSGIVEVIFFDDDMKCKIKAYYFCSFLKDYPNLHVIIDTEKKDNVKISHFSQIRNDKDKKNNSSPLFFIENSTDNHYSLLIEINRYKLSQSQSGNKLYISQLEDELKYWDNWHSTTKYPDKISSSQKKIFKQSLSILKMGQCRENGKSYGQILASLPPGMWNICWIRDAAYALNGLILSNHYEEAKKALEFFLNAECGKYVDFKVAGEQCGLGSPYQISVCRYFGNGSEESDGGDDPNIELDGFGLFLWVMEKYIDYSGDEIFLKKHWPVISEKIADILVLNIDKKYNLIRRDSSIWERHIKSNGKENGWKYFTYTNLTAIKGLDSAAKLANKMKANKLATTYKNAVQTLSDGFFKHQIDHEKKIIKSCAELNDIEKYMDASVIEAINFGIVKPSSEIAVNTLKAFDKYLQMKNRKNGFFRSLDGTHYDNQEWIVIDLRIAAALKKMMQPKKAERLINWVSEQSKENFNIIAELYNELTADYEGAVPMCGFGPGAYIASFMEDK